MSRNEKNKDGEVNYKYIFKISFANRINLIKKWLSQEIPCDFHCTQSWKCKKLSEYKSILEQLFKILEYELRKKPKEAIRRIWELSSKALDIRSKIRSCIYIQKRLTRKGYNIWREYPAYQMKSFIKGALDRPIPCLDVPCVKINKCRKLSNYSNLIKELESISKSFGNHKQPQRQILYLTTKASESHCRLSRCAGIQKSKKQKQSRLFQ